MEPHELVSTIESILFVSSNPLSVKQLSKILDKEPEAIQQALAELMDSRKNSGVVVLESNGEYQMATNSRNSTQVKNFLNAELREKLTDATVEVLAIIAYRQPISKAEIEAIRGVNSQYSIRHLLMRGLIEKVPNPNDARGYLYKTTTEFLMHLGVQSVNDLPEFEKLVENIRLPVTPALTDTQNADSAEPESQPQPVPVDSIQPVIDEPVAPTENPPAEPEFVAVDAIQPAEPEGVSGMDISDPEEEVPLQVVTDNSTPAAGSIEPETQPEVILITEAPPVQENPPAEIAPENLDEADEFEEDEAEEFDDEDEEDDDDEENKKLPG